MKPFLEELAEKVYHEHPKLDTLTFIFPNRRAVLYFKKYISEKLSRPTFSPRIITIEDFVASLSTLRIPDKLELIHHLFGVYQETTQVQEAFDSFYFWGDMLLRDFDEVDKYRVNAEQLFKDLSHQKELDSSFDFLTAQQKEFLKSFWGSFDEGMNESKKKFLHVWRDLFSVYTNFRRQLASQGLAYEGMLHREVAERLERDEIDTAEATKNLISFVGFNALTKSEETVIRYFIEKGAAQVYWDLDEYYVNSEGQEAGDFFKEYREHTILQHTFPTDMPANFRKKKNVKIFGAAQNIGQTKLMAQVLQETLMNGADPEDTAVVLPDEKLLFPVLNGISGVVDKLNVTMGFPLSNTPLFNLVELLIEMQMTCKEDKFNHRQAMAILGHPYGVAADVAEAAAKRKEILEKKWINIDGDFLRTGPVLYQSVFRETPPSKIIDYLRNIIHHIGSMSSVSEIDREYAFHFITLLNRMETVLSGAIEISPDTSRREAFKPFLRLFRQLVRSGRIPFAGEPLKGLQIMGVLETRNLDFKNVFILSLNEGAFPTFGGKGSYIPYNIRRAYSLPTTEHLDAIYAYLFYRILQRSENVFLFYNSETDVLGQGEMSRYLQQLIFESGWEIERKTLHNPVQPHPVEPIVVPKDERTFTRLAQYCMGGQQPKGLSPTALNDYIECRLRFYFRHVARIREPKEVEEELDARMLGTFLHDIMDFFYQEVIKRKKTKNIEASDLDNYEVVVDAIIDRVFIKQYNLDKTRPVVYEGQRLVVREVIKSFVERIIRMDRAYAPFRLEALERDDLTCTLSLEADGHPVVVLGGKIDRADSKDGVLRVIDYKTGKDTTEIKNGIAGLFAREGERNKAAFQTMLYALLYEANSKTEGMRIVPGLLNRMNLFDDNFKFGLKYGKQYIDDVRPLLPEFKQELKTVLEELYNPDVPFTQTENTELCRNCPYRGICYR